MRFHFASTMRFHLVTTMRFHFGSTMHWLRKHTIWSVPWGFPQYRDLILFSCGLGWKIDWMATVFISRLGSLKLYLRGRHSTVCGIISLLGRTLRFHFGTTISSQFWLVVHVAQPGLWSFTIDFFEKINSQQSRPLPPTNMFISYTDKICIICSNYQYNQQVQWQV